MKQSADPFPFITLETEDEVKAAREELEQAAQQVDTNREAFLVAFRKLTYAYDQKQWKPKGAPSIGFEWLVRDNNIQILRQACGSMAAFFTPLFEYLSSVTPHVLSPEFLALLDAEELEPFARIAACSMPTLPLGVPWVKNLAAAGVSNEVLAEIVLDRLEKADTENPGATSFYVAEFLSASCNDVYFTCSDTPRCTSIVGCYPQWMHVPNDPTQWSVLSNEQLLQALRICIGHKGYSTNVLGSGYSKDVSLYDVLLVPRFESPADLTLMAFLRDLMIALPDLKSVAAYTMRFMPSEYITQVLKHRTDCFFWAISHAIHTMDEGLLVEMINQHPAKDPKAVLHAYGSLAGKCEVGATQLTALALRHGFEVGILSEATGDWTYNVYTNDGPLEVTPAHAGHSVGSRVLFHRELKTPDSTPHPYPNTVYCTLIPTF